MKSFLSNAEEAICSHCGEQCQPYKDDLSFSHVFGIERVEGDWLSKCCDAALETEDGDEWFPEFDGDC